MASELIYRSLKEGEIRVLELQPHFGKEDSPLRGAFCHCSLDVEPIISYKTISWCWGAPKPTASITIESETLRVPQNAGRVLRRLRYSSTVRNIWIDSICINQSDLAERATQVEMMGQVYSRGAGNIVYLGEVSDNIAKATFTNIESLYEEAREDTGNFSLSRHALEDRNFSPPRKRTPIDEEEILRLVSCPWFSRIWVVQEIALSVSNTCLWGSYEIALCVILRVFSWLGSTRLLHLDRRLREDRAFGNCVGLSRFEADTGESGRWPALRSLLMLHSLRDATDPRDAVYALIGLTQWGRDRTEIPALLRPDYKKSVPKVFRDATRCAVQEDRSLRILHYVDHGSEVPLHPGGFCSWAWEASVDWNSNEDTSVFLSDMYSPPLIDAPEFAESLDDPDSLILRGFVTDVVESTTVVHMHRDLRHEKNLEAIIQGLLQRGLRSHADVALTLTAGTCWDDSGAERWRDNEEAEQSLRALLAFMQRDGDDPERVTSDLMGLAGGFWYSIWHAARNRRLFHVESGFKLGLGPRAVMQGDIIAVLHGSHFPFVLRRIAGSVEYQLVGTAYFADYPSVHDLEATHQLETFHLR